MSPICNSSPLLNYYKLDYVELLHGPKQLATGNYLRERILWYSDKLFHQRFVNNGINVHNSIVCTKC